jgi:hypothetical protein
VQGHQERKFIRIKLTVSVSAEKYALYVDGLEIVSGRFVMIVEENLKDDMGKL